MSKNHSIPRNRIYQLEMIVVGITVAIIVTLGVVNAVTMFKPSPPVPPANMQLIQLQNAINIANPPEK